MASRTVTSHQRHAGPGPTSRSSANDLLAVGRRAQEDPIDRRVEPGPDPEPDLVADPQPVRPAVPGRDDVPGRAVVVEGGERNLWSTLHRAGGQAGDDVLLHGVEQDTVGIAVEQRAGREHAEVGVALAGDQAVQADGEGLGSCVCVRNTLASRNSLIVPMNAEQPGRPRGSARPAAG